MPVLGFIFYIIFKDRAVINKQQLPLLFFLLFLNGAYGLSSNNSFFATTSISAFFTMLAILTLLVHLSKAELITTRLINLSALCLAVTFSIIITSLGNPYRQPPFLWSYSSKASVRVEDTQMIVSSFTADYLNSLHDFAKIKGLRKNTPMLDLSGRTPGTIYALGGYTPKMPWIYSGFSGLKKFTFLALNRFSCEEIADLWIIALVNENSKQNNAIAIDPRVLYSFGAIFPDDYELADRLTITNSNVTSFQFFYKPLRSKEEGVSACIAKKIELGLMPGCK
jgi:hypothetical protein